MRDFEFTVIGVRPLSVVAGKAGQRAIASAYAAGSRMAIVSAQASVLACAEAQGIAMVPPELVGEEATSLVLSSPVGEEVGTFFVHREGEEAFFRTLADKGEVTIPCGGFSGEELPRE